MSDKCSESECVSDEKYCPDCDERMGSEYNPWKYEGITEVAYWKKRYLEQRLKHGDVAAQEPHAATAEPPSSGLCPQCDQENIDDANDPELIAALTEAIKQPGTRILEPPSSEAREHPYVSCLRLEAEIRVLREAGKRILNTPQGTLGDCDEWDAAMQKLDSVLTALDQGD